MWMTDQGQFERIIRKHGVNRVLFGTDSPWDDLAKAVEQVRSCGLTEAEQTAVFWDNAAIFWGFPQ